MDSKSTGITTFFTITKDNVNHVHVISKKLKKSSPYLKPYKNEQHNRNF
jgi:hypothetical protein